MYIQYNKKNMIYERKRTRGDIEKLFRNLNLPHQHNQKKKNIFSNACLRGKKSFFYKSVHFEGTRFEIST